MAYRQRRPYRGGRGRGGGGYRGLSSSEYQHQGFVPQPVRTTYDYAIEKGNFHAKTNAELNFEKKFRKELLDRAANLTPSEDVRKQICDYAGKVIAALEKERVEKTLECGVGQIMHVGSFVTETCTHSSDKSDVVVQLSILPSFETVRELGDKIVENMRKADETDTSMSLPQDYGCLIIAQGVQVRVLVTIQPTDASKLEPELHLGSHQLMLNYFAVRHTNWYLEMSKSMPDGFLTEYQALVKVLKDCRSRFSDFQSLSVWALQYLAFYCLANGPNRNKISMTAAFRRFFELIAAGMFLPKAPCLVDPTTQSHRIGFDLTLPQMDALCTGAQTIVRVFGTGVDGYRAVLGTHGTAADLAKATTTWKGIEISPSEAVFKTDDTSSS